MRFSIRFYRLELDLSRDDWPGIIQQLSNLRCDNRKGSSFQTNGNSQLLDNQFRFVAKSKKVVSFNLLNIYIIYIL